MYQLIFSGISIVLAVLFLVLWLRERRHAQEAEVVAYGLRSEDDSDENTKTSISMMEAEYTAAMDKLEQIGEIRQDEWGKWVWSKTGEPMGDPD
jgi:hypothetical protein